MTTGRKGAIDVKQTKKTDLLLSKMREFELIWFPFTDREPPPPKKKKKKSKAERHMFSLTSYDYSPAKNEFQNVKYRLHGFLNLDQCTYSVTFLLFSNIS